MPRVLVVLVEQRERRLLVVVQELDVDHAQLLEPYIEGLAVEGAGGVGLDDLEEPVVQVQSDQPAARLHDRDRPRVGGPPDAVREVAISLGDDLTAVPGEDAELVALDVYCLCTPSLLLSVIVPKSEPVDLNVNCVSAALSAKVNSVFPLVVTCFLNEIPISFVASYDIESIVGIFKSIELEYGFAYDIESSVDIFKSIEDEYGFAYDIESIVGILMSIELEYGFAYDIESIIGISI